MNFSRITAPIRGHKYLRKPAPILILTNFNNSFLVGKKLPVYICAINQTLKHKAMANTIETTALRNKTIVLAKTCQFGLHAVSYMNDKQATKKAMDLKAKGIDCSVYQSWGSNVRYIKIH